eukprot:4347878-Prymnesium_polylepis.1
MDQGPDRVDLDDDANAKRRAQHERGMVAHPGLPNGSSANQEADQIFGQLRMRNIAQAEVIVAEREKVASKARQQQKKAPPVNLTVGDLPRIVNGRATDPPEEQPFSYAFLREGINGALDKVGAVSSDGWVTLEFLNHAKMMAGAAEGLDGAAGGAKLASAAEWIERHKANRKKLAELGMDDEVLEVIPNQ